MMNDAQTAMAKDAMKALLGKAASTALSGAGGQAAKILFGLILGEATDPNTALLNQISAQLTAMQADIKNLPQATSVYSAYYTNIGNAQSVVNETSQLLNFTVQRSKLYSTYEAYLASLTDSQWSRLVSVLLIDSDRDYYTLTDRILQFAYGITVQDITEADENTVVPFGDASQSYARYINSISLGNIPANIKDYVLAHMQISATVLTAICGVVSCARVVLSTFQHVVNSKTDPTIPKVNGKSLFENLSAATQNKITDRLANAEVKADLSTTSQGGVPQFYSNLLIPISNAPAYLCGNAFQVYNYIINGSQKFTLRNLAVNSYVSLDGPEGASIANRIQGICDYWSTRFGKQPVYWNISFSSKNSDSTINLTGPGVGYLYVVNLGDVVITNYKVYASPSTTNFGTFKWVTYTDWKLQLVPLSDIKTGPGKFAFTIVNTGANKALVNEIPVIGSSGLSLYKLDPYDGNHQWDIVPVMN